MNVGVLNGAFAPKRRVTISANPANQSSARTGSFAHRREISGIISPQWSGWNLRKPGRQEPGNSSTQGREELVSDRRVDSCHFISLKCSQISDYGLQALRSPLPDSSILPRMLHSARDIAQNVFRRDAVCYYGTQARSLVFRWEPWGQCGNGFPRKSFGRTFQEGSGACVRNSTVLIP